VGVAGLPARHADDASATRLQVSATVLAHARLESDEAPVRITAADVARGYVDVARRYGLRTNAPGRVVLQFQPRTGYTQAIDVDGFGPPLSITDAGLEVAPQPTREIHLSFRLWVPHDLPPGEYPWPVHVAAVVH
jgi:hypothetical protein